MFLEKRLSVRDQKTVQDILAEAKRYFALDEVHKKQDVWGEKGWETECEGHESFCISSETRDKVSYHSEELFKLMSKFFNSEKSDFLFEYKEYLDSEVLCDVQKFKISSFDSDFLINNLTLESPFAYFLLTGPGLESDTGHKCRVQLDSMFVVRGGSDNPTPFSVRKHSIWEVLYMFTIHTYGPDPAKQR